MPIGISKWPHEAARTLLCAQDDVSLLHAVCADLAMIWRLRRSVRQRPLGSVNWRDGANRLNDLVHDALHAHCSIPILLCSGHLIVQGYQPFTQVSSAVVVRRPEIPLWQVLDPKSKCSQLAQIRAGSSCISTTVDTPTGCTVTGVSISNSGFFAFLIFSTGVFAAMWIMLWFENDVDSAARLFPGGLYVISNPPQ
jgi:hypothetical protein